MSHDSNPETEKAILTPDEFAALDEGIKLAESGQSWTWDEVKTIARKRCSSWKTIPAEHIA